MIGDMHHIFHIPAPISRRTMIGRSLLAAGGAMFAEWPIRLEAENDDSPDPRNHFPRMVQEFFVHEVKKRARLNRNAKAVLKTRQDAEAYVQSVRERILQCFGPFPEKSPLHPRISGVIERHAYRIEKIIFESRPEFLVTGNLYVPQGRSLPLPGVVATCGHSNNGKAAEPYQAFAQGLARQGYVVFLIDPIGQGERLQYLDPNLQSRVGVGVREHLKAGNQQFLVGEFIGAWRAWDGIRALDYLLTREEVDPRHLGVTGNSGGGTMTTWLCGVESRWTMAAPSCFVTTFRRNLENELPADTEQCPPHALALGLDHEDFIAAMAPKPVILLAKEKDFFDIRGTEAAAGRLRHLYRLLGAEDNIALFAGPTTHGYSRENREAMYRWFNRLTGISSARAEPEIRLEADETLQCTPNGQVGPLGSRTVFSFTRERSRKLAGRRRPLPPAELRNSVAKILNLPLPHNRPAPDYRILRPFRSPNYPKPHATPYAVQTESGIHAVVYRLDNDRLLSRPPGSRRAILYVAHRSSDAELRHESLIRQLIQEEPDSTFYACDVRGIGESQPDTCGNNMFLHPYGSDYFYAIHSFMLDRPYLGQKTHDLLRVLDWLNACGHAEIHLAASGWGTLPATFAAMFSKSAVQITLKNALASYSAVAESELYDWPLSTFLPNVLTHFDLPECYRSLEPKGLRQITPRNATLP